MPEIVWDQTGKREFETGVDHGVLYEPDATGAYTSGVAWNGLTAVTESPSGAESNPQYADNIKYLNLVSAEEFGATIEAFTYPNEFAQCDGTATPRAGISIGQQGRRMFGLSYRTLVGNDTEGTNLGYKIHLIYGAQAAPSEKAYTTINDSPEALTFSWELSTSPVPVSSVPNYKPTASVTIDSRDFPAETLKTFEDILYGTATASPRLPLPDEVIEHFGGAVALVAPTAPTFKTETNTITIPTTPGVVYQIKGAPVTGSKVITEDTTVTAVASEGSTLDDTKQDHWTFKYNAG